MAQRNRPVLKNYFLTDLKPTQAQFADLIDSVPNITEEGTPVPNSRQVNSHYLTEDIILTTADIADSTNKRYVTDAQLALIGENGETATAGENVVAGEVCYLKSDGKYWKAKADAEATSSTRLLMANATITANNTGNFLKVGPYTTTGLTVGANYYLDATTAGAITTTAPGSGKVVRLVGQAKSSTIFSFEPSENYLLIA